MRQKAARELRNHGLAAKALLIEALSHSDAEVRAGGRACLSAILDDDRQQRFEIAAADPSRLDEVDLPGWRRFRATIGADPDAQELFLKMFAAEPQLLESAAPGGKSTTESMLARCRQIQAFSKLPIEKSERQPVFATVAALAFVGADPSAEMPPQVMTSVMSHLNRSEFQERLLNAEGAPVRRLLTAWTYQMGDCPITYQNLLLAARCNVKEVIPAAKLLAEDATASPESRMYAILVVGKLGGSQDAQWITRFLNDDSVCSAYAYLREGSRGRYETQLRDVALATLLHVTKQDHKQYGFRRLRGHSQTLFNTSSIGFAAGEPDRDEAIGRWREWERKHPLPECPLLAPPGSVSSFGHSRDLSKSRDSGGESHPAMRVAQVQGDISVNDHEPPRPPQVGAALAPPVPPQPQLATVDDRNRSANLGDLPPFYRTDRQVRVWLSRAEEAIADEQFVDAVQLINAVLNSPLANSYQPDRLRPIHVGIRAEAERLLAQLPPNGLRVYEAYVGHTASRQLKAAVESRNPLAIADVARRYFFTRAGARAELLWGTHLYDTQKPMAAAAAFARIKLHPQGAMLEPELSFRLAAAFSQAGFPTDAELAINGTQPPRGATFEVGNHRYAPGGRDSHSADKFVRWLQGAIGRDDAQWSSTDWPIFGGDPTRNRFATGERPLLRARWSVKTVTRPEIRDALAKLSAAYVDQRRAAVPGAHPIAVDGVIVSRTPAGLLAVKMDSGDLSWQVKFDAALEDRLIDELRHGNEHLLYRELDERMWGDAASGRLSSDGSRVYAIHNFGQVGSVLSQRMIMTPYGQRKLEPHWHDDQNQLVAFDLETEGKIVWSLGGSDGDCESSLADAYFLGPPLPLGDQLFVLVERDQMVQLLSLDAECGHVMQTLTLASLRANDAESSSSANRAAKSAARHAQRRSGSMPAYQDGILVCPTSDGGFAGVDLSQNEVLWTYRATPRYLKEAFKVWQPADEETVSIDPQEPRLLDGEVLISGKNVLIAPLEMSALLCLDLQTGDVRWEWPLGDLRYIATSSDGVVLLVGRSGLHGVDLETGKKRWTSVTLPAGSAPSGRGFTSGDLYILPLSTAELAVVDIPTGTIQARLKSHDVRAPGNLICIENYVVSQTVDRLEIFEQLSFALSQAKADLEDGGPTTNALLRYGEILMYAGDYAAACEQLQNAFDLEPDEHALRLLCQSVLAALDFDYKRFQPLAAEILAREVAGLDNATRREFIRREAEYAQQQGEVVRAFEAIVQLIELAGDDSHLVARRPTLDAGETAWLRGQIKRLRQQATRAELSLIDARVVDLYDGLPDDRAAIVRFATLFPDHPLADTCFLRLLDEFDLEDPLERQMALIHLTHSRRAEIRREASLRHLSLLVHTGRLREAAQLVRELAGNYEDVQERDGFHQMVGARFADNELWKPQDSELPQWPTTAIREAASDQRAPYGRRYSLKVEEARDAYQHHLLLEIRSDAQAIIARNLYGIKRWEADLRGQEEGSLLPMNAEAVRARQVGHVLIIWRGHEVLAIDLMTPATAPARILWRNSLTVSFPGRVVQASTVVRPTARPGELPRLSAFDRSGVPLGELGPANRNYVAYQRGHTLEAVHPLSGKVLWRRHDVVPGSKVLGDEDYMIYVEPDCRVAVVLQADDGRELGRVLVPARETWITTSGRRIISWDSKDSPHLAIVDPAEGLADGSQQIARTIYFREFVPGASVYRIGWEEVAVCDPKGNFTIVRCKDGQALVNKELPPQPKMNALYVTKSQDRFVAIISGPTETDETVFAVPGGYQCPIVHGTAFGFDVASGELLWQTPVANQSVDLNQPSHLPVLTFACRALPPVEEANQARHYSSRVYCLDKRSGEVLIDERESGSINRVELAPDFTAKTIEIRTTQNAYRLKFIENSPANSTPQAQDRADGVLVAPKT
ncbi:MAG: PQQ-like beta-propeller repeat protein [Pirellulales bacterium]|nr:PQQ-like beta-propeller repeat protein [Pirellulales bacterium]